MNKPIKVIDLFSGPGGLGEGFSSIKNDEGSRVFKLISSIEKEPSAYRTLKLRAFYRQFDDAPKEYYDFLKGKLGKSPEEQLYKLPKFKAQVEAANREALNLELGKDDEAIYSAISQSLGDDECVLIGGPPCQAYSVAGVARNKSNQKYDPTLDHRNFLYKEYLKVLSLFQPLIFVMENVKGMLSAKVNGKLIHKSIFKDLENPSESVSLQPLVHKSHRYKIVSFVATKDDDNELQPKDYVIAGENYGIPQRRHRVILLGIREDIADLWKNETLALSENKITVSDVLCDLPKLRSGLSKEENTSENWLKSIKSNALKTISSLKKHDQSIIADAFETAVVEMGIPKEEQGRNHGIQRISTIKNSELSSWFYDKKLGRYVCNHETRGHLALDLQRYLYCSIWAKVGYDNNWERLSPRASDFPDALIPNHKNFKSGKFADRFRVQPNNLPATTITCHISKDGHYYIHPDFLQCRSLTVREAARIQTFPDNYFFVGNRTQQYVQVGNAVPPLLSAKIAKLISKFLLNI
ncbi:DNA cytosine methyltransferase [Parashewanella tropica]|uniref:DNA cytosine methyltransferase n=1 Tax=Parashewanella tropica TaxID=2547970 RepID=UPI001059896D|nr:DNA cytosine methyltransferase [Parashewanella tropica]